MKTYAYGFPKLGPSREFKTLVEGYWKKEITENMLETGMDMLQKRIIEEYRKVGIDSFSETELSLYDPMLDTAIMVGIYNPRDYGEYFSLCRGSRALAMTKWFNTNYHYLVTDFSSIKKRAFKPNPCHFSLRISGSESKNIIGPYTFLKLSKGIESRNFDKMLEELSDVYVEIIKSGGNWRIDEPAFCLDMSDKEKKICAKVYKKFVGSLITIMTYYDSPDNLKDLFYYPVSAIGLDLIRGESAADIILKEGFPADKTLIAGLVDGRNIWKNNIKSTREKVEKLSQKVADLCVSNAAPLYHIPYSVEAADVSNPRLKEKLAFAVEKLAEISMIAGRIQIPPCYNEYKDNEFGLNREVRVRTEGIKQEDYTKKTDLAERRILHDKILNLPLFSTTTIGSFPQTAEVRAKRAEFVKGKLSKPEFDGFIKSEINKLIKFQEELGIDVLVHGEFERTDMVEFFAQKLDGIATTANGWVLSYGTRVYRPPIIYGDVSRPKPMTIDEIVYAQSLTEKPVKGMLTGPVTIIAWSFVREDLPIEQVALQISLCIRDEIEDYEKAGIKIVQVDEPAFKERAPLKRAKWDWYFKWAVDSFNLATNTKSETQIHTHMCYSEFKEIIRYINRMDFDVISIEASRSGGDIISGFAEIDFKRQIGLGVWDVHSPTVPPVSKMKKIVKSSLRFIPARNFWINPDCGLKTRGWEETKEALKNMVATAKAVRKEYAGASMGRPSKKKENKSVKGHKKGRKKRK